MTISPKRFLKASLLAGSIFASAIGVQAQDNNTPEIPVDVHDTMHNDIGVYARGKYLAYVKTPNPTANQIARYGLTALAIEAKRSTSIEIDGIVGIDLEIDDLTPFRFLYWPSTEQQESLSQEARAKLRKFKNNFGVIAADVIDGRSIRTSQGLRTILQNAEVRPVEVLSEGHTLTETFCIMDNLRGTTNREVLIERIPEDAPESDRSAFIIGAQNWATAWAGASVGPDAHEQALCSGLNMIYYAYAGETVDAEWMQAIITEKRHFREMNRQWQRERKEKQDQSTPPAP